MPARKYLRQSKLTIVKPRPDPATGVGSFFGLARDNAIELVNTRIQFEIKKTLSSAPNTCELTVTNLAEGTRAELAGSTLVAILEAGHDGELSRLFAGDVIHVDSAPDGTEWLTRLQVQDGGRAYAYARVARSYRAGAVVLDAVREAATAMGLVVSRQAEALQDLKRAVAAGASMAGRASTELSRLLLPFGLGWSIQDGELVVLPERGIRPGEAIVIDEDAGMIGSPRWGSPDKAGKKSPISIDCLLFPELEPGVLVQVRSRTANGNFKVAEVTHVGDTHGGDCMTSIECKATA